MGELNNRHTKILDADEYKSLKGLYPKSGGSRDAWYNELNNEKSQLRYLNLWVDTQSAANSSVSNGENNIRKEILIKGKVAYLSISSLDNNDEDMKVIKPFLKEIKDYDALIIDIRGNGGGDSRYWHDGLVPLIINKPLTNKEYYVYRGGEFSTKFIKCVLGDYYNEIEPIGNINKIGLKNLPPEINKDFKYYIDNTDVIKPKDSIGFKGKIYMLVDHGVYSSAEMFATFAKHTGFATIVGEKTGGDGIGNDPLLCSLPNSGYILKFSYVMGLTSDGSSDEEFKTEPDIKVDDAAKNSNLDNDKTIQTVLEPVKNFV